MWYSRHSLTESDIPEFSLWLNNPADFPQILIHTKSGKFVIQRRVQRNRIYIEYNITECLITRLGGVCWRGANGSCTLASVVLVQGTLPGFGAKIEGVGSKHEVSKLLHQPSICTGLRRSPPESVLAVLCGWSTRECMVPSIFGPNDSVFCRSSRAKKKLAKWNLNGNATLKVADLANIS